MASAGEPPHLSFSGLLRQLRAEARLTQEELAAAARLSPRSVSDLERGINRTARRLTAERLAAALSLAGPQGELFVAAARGRVPAICALDGMAGARKTAFAVHAAHRLAPDFPDGQYFFPDEASDLLARLAGRPDVVSGADAAALITRTCGYLPLAIGMLGRQLRHHPARSLPGLAADLAASRDRLAMMHAENLSVAAAFDLSYQDVVADAGR